MSTDSTASPLYTVRGLVARLRAESAQGRAPIGERAVRRLIASGEVPVVPIGNRDLVRWDDWLEFVARRAATKPAISVESSRADRIENEVRERIREEASRTRVRATRS